MAEWLSHGKTEKDIFLPLVHFFPMRLQWLKLANPSQEPRIPSESSTRVIFVAWQGETAGRYIGSRAVSVSWTSSTHGMSASQEAAEHNALQCRSPKSLLPCERSNSLEWHVNSWYYMIQKENTYKMHIFFSKQNKKKLFHTTPKQGSSPYIFKSQVVKELTSLCSSLLILADRSGVFLPREFLSRPLPKCVTIEKVKIYGLLSVILRNITTWFWSIYLD